jgi:hypothetical protein
MDQAIGVELLSEFVRFLETGEVAEEAFAEEVFFDMNVPSWRYQLRGREAAAGLFHSEGPARVRVCAVSQTSNGFVAEINYDTVERGNAFYHRSVSVVTIHDGQIAEVVHYCTGPWDEATRARQAREAPMLRPDA